MTGPAKLLRGRLLTFDRLPKGDDDTGFARYIADGGLLVEDGRIAAMSDFGDVRTRAPDADVIDHRPHLLVPGFIDPHVHFPQTQVIASPAPDLLTWLKRYTFPAEAAYADEAHARAMAPRFLDLLIAHGTTTAAVYGSVHPGSVRALLDEAAVRHMSLIAGKPMMDTNVPAAVRDTAEQGATETAELIALAADQDRFARQQVAITVRFAVTSSEAQLAAAGELAAAHGEVPIQTHLSENDAEIAEVMRRFPNARDYTDVYARHGLLRDTTLLAHCIHLSDREAGVLAETGAVAVACPTSNLFLGSGLFDARRLAAAGVRQAVATDIGGGTNYALLRTMDEMFKVSQLKGHVTPPLRAFCQATRGNAEALGLAGEVGSLSPGAWADVIALDAHATAAMALRMAAADTLDEELMVLQTLGDDRAVAAVYVAGEPVR
ncbi:MAG: guanine deaminase [Pseudomonadota bacterium]